MADFIEKEVLTVRDYDLYCHYVAGLVGIGLCQVCLSSTPLSLLYACYRSEAHRVQYLTQNCKARWAYAVNCM